VCATCPANVFVHDMLLNIGSLIMQIVKFSVTHFPLCCQQFVKHFPSPRPTHHISFADRWYRVWRCVAGELDMSEPVHVRMLQTVYQRLTGTRLHCPQYGSHWEHIGFQVLVMSVCLFKCFLNKAVSL